MVNESCNDNGLHGRNDGVVPAHTGRGQDRDRTVLGPRQLMPPGADGYGIAVDSLRIEVVQSIVSGQANLRLDTHSDGRESSQWCLLKWFNLGGHEGIP